MGELPLDISGYTDRSTYVFLFLPCGLSMYIYLLSISQNYSQGRRWETKSKTILINNNFINTTVMNRNNRIHSNRISCAAMKKFATRFYIANLHI